MPLEDGLKGAHFGDPANGYDIYYLDALWEGAREHTVLHETYEIIYETLCDLESGAPPDRRVCPEADRFAAAVLMQPETFADFCPEQRPRRSGPAEAFRPVLCLGDAAFGRSDAWAASAGGPLRAKRKGRS